MADTRNSLQGVKPHKDYFLSGGDLHIIAEDREFCVHSYFFLRDSAKFRSLLASPSPGQPKQGSSHLTAIKLNATAKEFETFLWVFYIPTYSLYEATVSDWSCILRLAYDWKFDEVGKLAVRELEKMPMPVVDRIALYQEHHVAQDFLVRHYAALCIRGHPLALAESEQLGMATVVLINQAMHAIYSQMRGSDGSSSPIDSNGELILKIIAHIRKEQGAAAETAGGSVTISPSFPLFLDG
ncbi:hypothetical protein B0H15DRAFT_651181 [Mycena belliarum]|uniref:BTB domain-containing protein n=1 Tax=Mycena belliarum TaxID=1033014 RepID=A0AAD6TTL9_9AGAR|nr:hypothetical protein B0H15DRAFT_651181 [Mycena belliae]